MIIWVEALLHLPMDSPAVHNLESIEASTIRAAKIAEQMLHYSGRSGLTMESIHLNTLLEGMLDMLRMSVPSKVSILFLPDAALSSILGDTSHLRHLVIHLVRNAAESFGDQGGTIRLLTGSMECSRAYLLSCCFAQGASEGQYIFLEISDSGCGMDQEVAARLFDPFFSTKFAGQGLGMAAVLGIVRQHKGAIHLTSHPGEGSTFRILFPVQSSFAENSRGGCHD